MNLGFGISNFGLVVTEARNHEIRIPRNKKGEIPIRNPNSKIPDGEVVYRRTTPPEGDETGEPIRPNDRTVVELVKSLPAISPLIVGFTVLLALILTLGYLSVRRMDDVSFRVLDLEHQHATKLGRLMKLRLGLTKLNNEARARQEADARRELKPPFDFLRVGHATKLVIFWANLKSPHFQTTQHGVNFEMNCSLTLKSPVTCVRIHSRAFPNFVQSKKHSKAWRMPPRSNSRKYSVRVRPSNKKRRGQFVCGVSSPCSLARLSQRELSGKCSAAFVKCGVACSRRAASETSQLNCWRNG